MPGSKGQVLRVEFLARNVLLGCNWLENRWVVYLSDRVTEMSLLHHGNMTSLVDKLPVPSRLPIDKKKKRKIVECEAIPKPESIKIQ